MLELFQDVFSPPRHLILLVVAAWIGLVTAEKRSERHGVNPGDFNSLIFLGMIAYLVGGRISFAIQNISAFARSPLGLISINPDLFDPAGALAASILGALIFVQKRRLIFWSTLDALTPCLSIIAVGTSLSNLAAGTGFGRPADLPWAVELWGADRHPTQIYNAIAFLTIFCLIWFVIKAPRPGLLFLTFCAFSFSTQVFLLGFRGDIAYTSSGFNPQQILAWFLLGTCLVIIEQRMNTKTHG